VPARKLSAYVQMLPSLEAHRHLQLIDAMAYAFGNMPKESAPGYIQRLQARAVRAEEQYEEMMAPAGYRPKSAQEMAALIGGTPGTSMVLEEGPETRARREAEQ
jgi:hypothetical protein